jgi:guanylate kinase
LLEIEVQGASLIRKSDFDAIFVFLLPPSMETLQQRLRDRGTDSDAKIEQRLGEGNSEIAMARIFDYAVINDALSEAVSEVQEIIRAEREGSTADVRARFGLAQVLERWQSETGRSDTARD